MQWHNLELVLCQLGWIIYARVAVEEMCSFTSFPCLHLIIMCPFQTRARWWGNKGWRDFDILGDNWITFVPTCFPISFLAFVFKFVLYHSLPVAAEKDFLNFLSLMHFCLSTSLYFSISSPKTHAHTNINTHTHTFVHYIHLYSNA